MFYFTKQMTNQRVLLRCELVLFEFHLRYKISYWKEVYN